MSAARPLPVLLLALSSLAAGGDRPASQWSSRLDRNAASPARNLPEKLTDENLLWELSLKGRAQFTIPTVARGEMVLVGTRQRSLADERLRELNPRQGAGALLCLDVRTGERKWEMLLRGLGSFHSYGGYGICNTPVVDANRVYVVDPAGNVVCLDLDGLANGNDGPFTDEAAYMANIGTELIGADAYTGPAPNSLARGWGDILWTYEMMERHKVAWKHAHSGTAVVDGDWLYVPTSNSHHCVIKVDGRGVLTGYSGKKAPPGHPVGRGMPSIVVLNKHTGKLVATDNLDVPRVYHGQWSSPSMGVVNGKKLLFFADGYGVLHALAALPAGAGEDGKVRTLEEVWRFDCVPPEIRRASYGKLKYVSRGGGGSAKELTEKLRANIIAAPVFHDGRIYVGLGRDHNYGVAPGILWCIDAGGTGDVSQTACVWKREDVATTMAAVAVADGLVYFVDSAGLLRCLDADTGETCWVQDMEHGSYYCEPLVADGKVYISTEREHWILRTGRERTVLFRDGFRGAEARTCSAIDGLLLVPHNRKLTAYTADGSAARR